MLFITSIYQQNLMFEDSNKNKIIFDYCYFDFILYFYLRVLYFVLLLNIYNKERL
jgi:hypothetical protein